MIQDETQMVPRSMRRQVPMIQDETERRIRRPRRCRSVSVLTSRAGRTKPKCRQRTEFHEEQSRIFFFFLGLFPTPSFLVGRSLFVFLVGTSLLLVCWKEKKKKRKKEKKKKRKKRKEEEKFQKKRTKKKRKKGEQTEKK